MKGSLVILFFFIVGVACGFYRLLPSEIPEEELSFFALCALMFCVGVGVGNDPDTLKQFIALNPRLAFLPLMTISGTLAGCWAVSYLIGNRTPGECMAVGAGFGYYSLSSVFIARYKGAELATVALVSNILREISALLFTPLLVRWFGKLAPISVGGATTTDTTLPVITRYCGRDYIIVSLFHGFAVDFSVPFLVTLFCSL